MHPRDRHLRLVHQVAKVKPQVDPAGRDRPDTEVSSDGPAAAARRIPTPRTRKTAVRHVHTASVASVPRRQRLATPHVGAWATVDAQMRVSLAAPFKSLEWEPGSSLVLELRRDGAVVVTPYDDDQQYAGQLLVTLDFGRRLLLIPTVRSWLDVAPGDQVIAVAVPEHQQMVLSGSTDMFIALTGLAATGQPTIPAPAIGSRGGSRGPRKAWQPRIA